MTRGTLRRDRDEPPANPGIPVSDAMPSAPGWLKNIDALREWHSIGGVMLKNRLLTAGNVGLLAHHCALAGVLVSIWESGDVPSASLLSVHRRQLSDLGLTGISIPVPSAKPNVFSELAKRHGR